MHGLPLMRIVKSVLPIFFWPLLIVSIGAFGLVALGPKLVARETLREEVFTQSQTLLDLEAEVSRLREVTAAFQTDRHFAAEVARVEFDATRPGEDVLTVEDRLALGRDAATIERPRRVSAFSPLAWQLLVVVTQSSVLRACLIAFAAFGTLIAFVIFHPGLIEPGLNETGPPHLSAGGPAATAPSVANGEDGLAGISAQPAEPQSVSSVLVNLLPRRYRR